MARGWGARLVARGRTVLAAQAPSPPVSSAGGDALPAVAPTAPPLRVETDVGVLLFQAHDQLMAPLIAEQGGRWEVEESDQLRAFLKPGMTFVDVGAHVGYMTLLGARAVGPSGRVIAVEASPANVELLRANVAANGATNVEIVSAAASDRTGTVTLSLSPWNTGDNRAYLVPEMERIEVPAVRLDDVVPADAHVDVVKLDTQGTDHRAVRGMEATLARCRPVLLAEFWPPTITELGDDPLAVLAQYADMGYQVRVLGHPEDGPVPTPAEVVEAAVSRHGEFCNLVLRPIG
ncbi:MAG: FkbM family methyltransferase [Acidimicrobiales bacterium]